MEHLFVYGTLQAEFNLAVLQLVSSNLQFISNATVIGALYDLGNYPGYFEAETGEVKGELYSIKDSAKVFEILDEYEGLADIDPEYSRKEITVTLPDGKQAESWIYVYQQQLRPEHKRIDEGDYIAFIRNKVSK